jgi:pantoate--beta-alanine ligase
VILVETIAETRQAVADSRSLGRIVGLVPTMGALHEGHGRLIEACRKECDFVVVSIFVNPTQFGPTEDFTRYPRTPEEDHRRCRDAGAALVFSPSVQTMYPNGASCTTINVPELTERLEGASRPGHFRGVATVVMKLFQIVQPDLAHFGEKDYQQLAVIRRMAADLNLPLTIRGVPTHREADGLAMSSRNRYLNAEERQAATVLWRALRTATKAVERGERSGDRVRQILRETVESERLARLDYVDVVTDGSVAPIGSIEPGARTIALIAARIGSARLIDNALLPIIAGSHGCS